MAEAKPFSPVKLVCGVIYREEAFLEKAACLLVEQFGSVDFRGPAVPFDLTDYYEPELGKGQKRSFLSFADLISPDRLSEIKLRTNALEEDLRRDAGRGTRAVNLDPGYLTASALFMATAKNFAHRVPLRDGIYAHLELLFTKDGVCFLDWTYPDFRQGSYSAFFLDVRKKYLGQIEALASR